MCHNGYLSDENNCGYKYKEIFRFLLIASLPKAKHYLIFNTNVKS